MQSLPPKKKTFSTNLEQIILKMCMKSQNIWITKATLRKKNKTGNMNLAVLKKTEKLQFTKQYPRNNLYNYGQLIYDKGVKTIQWRKCSLFIKLCLGNWTTINKYSKMNLEHSLIPYTKISSKCNKYLNVPLETIRLLEENIELSLA